MASLGEGAELAAVGADVGVIDVAVDDVGDGIAAARPAQRVGRAAHGREVRPARLEQPDDLGLAEPFSGCGALEEPGDFRARLSAGFGRSDALHEGSR